jgi:hypothetical protein
VTDTQALTRVPSTRRARAARRIELPSAKAALGRRRPKCGAAPKVMCRDTSSRAKRIRRVRGRTIDPRHLHPASYVAMAMKPLDTILAALALAVGAATPAAAEPLPFGLLGSTR